MYTNLLDTQQSQGNLTDSFMLCSKMKIWGFHGTQVTSPIVEILEQNVCEKMLSMESYPSTEELLSCKTVEDLCDWQLKTAATRWLSLPSLQYPSLFLAVINKQEMRAEVAVTGVKGFQ
jgi:hypothetical protein